MTYISTDTVSGINEIIDEVKNLAESCFPKVVTLTSTESEYIALRECGQELKFICILFQEIGVGKLPGVIFEEKGGAIFLAKNQQVGMCTKYLNI